MTLSLAYITCRKQPHIEWFWRSLYRECHGDFSELQCIVVDFYHGQRPLPAAPVGLSIRYSSPKPTVWQGPHRLTSRNYFAAANARNTALCLAPDGYLICLDDLSALMPGWLEAAKQAVTSGYVVAGAYQKVKNLNYDMTSSINFTDYPEGHDGRWNEGSDIGPRQINGGSFYGCSCGAPVEWLLDVNGWDEDADSTGSEDVYCGLMIERQGHPVYYDRRMLTVESEEGHEEKFARVDKGISPNDSSHRLLDLVLNHRRWCAPNYFGPGGIREVRRQAQMGLPFPVTGKPEHCWFDGQPLMEM